LALGVIVVGFAPILTCAKEFENAVSPITNTSAEDSVVVFM
jgi:hypothetical protein